MISMRHILILGALTLGAPCLLALSAARPALAQTASGPVPGQTDQQSTGPVAPISALYNALTKIEKTADQIPFEQRAQTLSPAVDRAFNIPTILQTSIGLRYRTFPDAQKQQLEQVFRQFTIARYVSNFSTGSGDTLTVLPQARPSPVGSDQIVQTRITSASGTVTKVDYLMRQFPQGWQAVDVLLDGHISQAGVQRSDFGSTVTTGDANPLIESLKKKIQSFSET